jgi:serine/threonine-protein kinase RsbW
MEEGEPGAIELHLPSKLGYEKVAMAAAASVAHLMGFSDQRVEDLKTAVAEACINSMEHGNRLDESLTVGVVLSIIDRSLEVKVQDHGSGIPGGMLTPDIDRKMEGAESPRGMGLFLIQCLVDEVEWTTSEDNGACARLVVHLDEAKCP